MIFENNLKVDPNMEMGLQSLMEEDFCFLGISLSFAIFMLLGKEPLPARMWLKAKVNKGRAVGIMFFNIVLFIPSKPVAVQAEREFAVSSISFGVMGVSRGWKVFWFMVGGVVGIMWLIKWWIGRVPACCEYMLE